MDIVLVRTYVYGFADFRGPRIHIRLYLDFLVLKYPWINRLIQAS